MRALQHPDIRLRGDDMFIQMLSSAAEHMLEHGALE